MADPKPPRPPPGSSLLFLREEEIRAAQDLLFFAYRDFTNAADVILEELGLGRAHHRALHFIGRNPGMTVTELLAILRITKQSLARVLSALVEQGYVAQAQGRADRRQRLLTLTPAGRGAGAAAVRAPARAPGGGLPRRRRAVGGGVPPGDARHHGRGRARLHRPRRRRGAGRAEALSGGTDGRGRWRTKRRSWWWTTTPACAALLQRYLAENGFRVTTAASAAEAREKLRFLQPDLMVLDVMMPGESGLELTESLRRDNADVPVLLLTARGAPEDRIAGFEAGADDYLPKPFEPQGTAAAHPRACCAARRAAAAVRTPPAGPLPLGAAGVRPGARRAARAGGPDPADRRRGGAADRAGAQAERGAVARGHRRRRSAWTRPASGRSTCR